MLSPMACLVTLSQKSRSVRYDPPIQYNLSFFFFLKGRGELSVFGIKKKSIPSLKAGLLPSNNIKYSMIYK